MTRLCSRPHPVPHPRPLSVGDIRPVVSSPPNSDLIFRRRRNLAGLGVLASSRS